MTNSPPGVGSVITDDELELLKLETLAGLWDVSKRTIEVLVRTGELKSQKILGSRRVRRTEARAYLERSSVSTSS